MAKNLNHTTESQQEDKQEEKEKDEEGEEGEEEGGRRRRRRRRRRRNASHRNKANLGSNLRPFSHAPRFFYPKGHERPELRRESTWQLQSHRPSRSVHPSWLGLNWGSPATQHQLWVKKGSLGDHVHPILSRNLLLL